MTSLSDLESLARAATPGPREISVDGRKLIVWQPSGMYQRLGYLDELPDGADLMFIIALSPDVVLKLLAVARAAEKCRHAPSYDMDMNLSALWDALAALTGGKP